MCVICVKKAGVELPSNDLLKEMWIKNPDGAGYMWNSDGVVHIHKGFMTFEALLNDLAKANLTKDDNIIYHFRISTQAKTREMTHPFPLTSNIINTKKLYTYAKMGVVHNGIINLTSNPLEKEYSDTALFVANYMTRLIKSMDDVKDPIIQNIIENLIDGSKIATLDLNGNIEMIGSWQQENGLYFSNMYFKPFDYSKYYIGKYWDDDYDDDWFNNFVNRKRNYKAYGNYKNKSKKHEIKS